MDYRDERDALRGGVENLEQALDEAKRELQAKHGDHTPKEPDPDRDGLQPALAAALTRQAAAAWRAKAWRVDRVFGVVLMVGGVCALVFCARFAVGRMIRLIPTASMWAVALGVMVGGYRRRKHEDWLRTNGIQLPARVVNVERRKDLRLFFESDYRLLFEVAGPRGPYDVACDVDVPLQHVAVLSGAEVNVRADSGNLQDILVEE